MISIENGFIKIVATKPKHNYEYEKRIVRPITLKGENYAQVEKFKNKQVFHENIKIESVENYLNTVLSNNYWQIAVHQEGTTTTYFIKGDNIKQVISSNNLKSTSSENNRKKQYILNEGENIPALVDLGVFTKEFKIINSKYDKYRQINRFIELIDDCFKKSNLKEISILDFGCGKSYLTFIVYYYFCKIKGIKAKIIGYDLKEDVVKDCNAIAKKYGYTDLRFVKADVSKDTLSSDHIDMVISLHACDTATDYALSYAIHKNVKYIFSVPCCQHEINLSIKKGGDLDILTKYGIIKERCSALLTDAIRGDILEDMGYSVDVLEFVDLAHSPKNLMIRATKTTGICNKNLENIIALKDKYAFDQTLFELVKDKYEI